MPIRLIKMYHKEVDEDGDCKGRPVASNTNAPKEKIAKKLSKIFNSMTPPEGKSVKKGIEFANLVNGTKTTRNEEIGSYDVTALYPSIPIPYSMTLLREWLMKNNVCNELIEAYADLASLCMRQNTFQFRDSIYKQTSGTSIGNSISSFIAQLFMCNFFDVVKSLFEEKMDAIEKDAVKFTVERQQTSVFEYSCRNRR